MTSNRFDETEFVDNPEPRCEVVLALDVSGSMYGQPISELNAGLLELDKALKADQLPTLAAHGGTPIGAAVEKSLDLLQDRKDTYKSKGMDYFCPWLFLISDGAPTDVWEAAADMARQEEECKGVSITLLESRMRICESCRIFRRFAHRLRRTSQIL